MSPSTRSPTARMIEAWLTRRGGLADRLKSARIGTGMSGAALAREIGWQQSKVSRLENGVTVPAPTDVEVWATTCKLPAAERRELVKLATEAQARQYNFAATLDQAEHQAASLAIHRAATTITAYESYAVPGPLQTEPYAMAMLGAWAKVLDFNPATIAEGAAIRAGHRAEVLDPRKAHRFIIAESVLTWAYGGPEVMADQLDAIVAAAELESVEVLVIPFGEISVPIGLGFSVYDDLAIYEHWRGEGMGTVEEFGPIADLLTSSALNPSASVAKVGEWMAGYRGPTDSRAVNG